MALPWVQPCGCPNVCEAIGACIGLDPCRCPHRPECEAQESQGG